MNKKNNIKQLQMLIIVALSILLYVNTWDHGFASDDTMMITENKFTKGGWEGIKKILTTDAFSGFLGEGKKLLSGGRYRPLSQIIFNLEYSLLGLSPTFWHIQNTIFFALAMLLAYLSLLKLFKTKQPQWTGIAFVATLIATSHPLNTEAVANIKSFDLILTLILSMAALYWSLKWYDNNKTIYLFCIAISLFLGILAKETALTFLGVIPLSILFFRRFQKKEFWILMSVLVSTISSYFIFRISLIGIPESIKVTELLNNPFLEASSAEKYATILFTWWHYIQLYLLPIELTHDYYPYTFELKQWSDTLVILSSMLYISLSIWSAYQLYKVVFKKQNSNFIAYGWLFYIFVFSISSNLFVSIGAFMNERFIFVADIGLALMLAYAILALGQKMHSNTPLIIYLIIVTLISIFGLKTIDRNEAWKDNFTLFTTDVAVSSNSAKCTVSAGGSIYEESLKEKNTTRKTKMLKAAENYLQQGIKIHPGYTQAHLLLGNVYFEMANYKQAFNAYTTCIRKGDYRDAPKNIKSLGLKLNRIKEYQSSIDVLNYCEEIGYSDSQIIYFIADSYLETKKVDSAIITLNRLIKTDSTYDESYNKLGEIYGRYKNNLDASEYYLIKGYEINPNNQSICENLGTLNGIRGNLEQSLHFYFRALDLMKKPNTQIYQNIALTYQNMGDQSNYNKYLQMARELRNSKTE